MIENLDTGKTVETFFWFIKLNAEQRKTAERTFFTVALITVVWILCGQHLKDDTDKTVLLTNENLRLRKEIMEGKAEIRDLYIENKGLLKERYGRVDTLAQANYKIIQKLEKK